MEAYLAPTFSAVELANALVRETTTANDSTVDLGPALRRAGYDIEAVEKQITALVAAHPGELVAHAEAMEDVAGLASEMKPALHNVTSSHAKLVRDFTTPYEEARDTHKAAAKLEQTAGLARALAWYLHLAKQIDAAQQERASLDTVVQAAKCWPQIRQLVTETPSLGGLAVVRAHEPTLAPAKQRLEQLAAAALREGTDKRRLVSGIAALRALDVDVGAAVTALFESLVGTSVLQLSRSSSVSPESFNDAVVDTKQRARTLGLVDAIFVDMGLPPAMAGGLAQTFWAQVAKNMDVKLRTMSVANQGAIRAMQSHRAKLFKSTESVPPLRAVFEKYLATSRA